MIYKKPINAYLTKDGEEYYVVKDGDLYKLNEIGARILHLCDGSNTLAAVSEKIAGKFNQPLSEVEADVNFYCDQLLELGLLIEER